VVYHLGASISISNDSPQIEAVNVQGTRNVVEACLACGVRRLVHCSSIHALVQSPLIEPLNEDRPLALEAHHPTYDRSKALGELEVRKGIEKGLDAIIINPTAIAGPFDFKPSFVGKAILAMARGKLPALVRGGYDWVDGRDVASGMIQAEKVAPAGAKYILSGHWRSVAELANLVSRHTRVKPPHITIPLWLASMGLPVINSFSRANRKEPLYTRFSLKTLRSNHKISHARASRDLGYQPRPFEETIADAVAWFKENGYLQDTEKKTQ
jgi:dihydroflavonol-4-reductase